MDSQNPFLRTSFDTGGKVRSINRSRTWHGANRQMCDRVWGGKRAWEIGITQSPCLI